MMKYKGYYGSVYEAPEGRLFYGKLEFIEPLVSYEAVDAKSIKKAFEEAVDGYLQMCDNEHIVPDKPSKEVV